ncbi:response regulator receiver sensor signal transduction histidine kinase [[Leptolyngbya] sp. PCC 7376]|uniref:hybrid sensor histidine kinase/response regulator n=1 Tax=[Leptolyngbya] sp. PCC 7376 TaxID=111781 RepID=UPI00029EFF4F|nr:response regulator [[Leptolyngbya] sp. PCC 7376]AFY40349.1 response regulator receiver sensor signal transduction histidine kinase [[Leptolyngbya] sp. PCC 7376]
MSNLDAVPEQDSSLDDSSTTQEVIFVVDDNTVNLSMMSKFLTRVGYSVRVAKDGQSALKKIAYEQPELILLDIMMPGMDGFETCQALKALPETKDIPIIFMTALAETVDKVKGLSVGAVDYITKPFQQDEVLARLRIQLKLRALNKQIESQNAVLHKTVEQLQRTQTQMIAQEKLASLGNLTAGIAHELRNPLNFVINFAESSQELMDELKTEINNNVDQLPADSAANISELIGFLNDNAAATLKHGQRASQIISSMMQHARSDNGIVEDVLINELIAEAIDFAYHSRRAKHHLFNAKIHQNYDSQIQKVQVLPAALSRVIINLLENAFDAVHRHHELQNQESENSNYSPQVWISTNVLEGNKLEIRIRDNGVGIPQELKEKIFDPFVTTKTPGEGTGLGLSISHDIVVGQHGGTLKLNLDLEEGTEFIIVLPKHQ